MTRWEYHFFTFPAFGNATNDFDPGTGLPTHQVRDAESLADQYRALYANEFARLGAEGWELTTSHVVPLFDEAVPAAILMIFKRPLPESD